MRCRPAKCVITNVNWFWMFNERILDDVLFGDMAFKTSKLQIDYLSLCFILLPFSFNCLELKPIQNVNHKSDYQVNMCC